MVKTMTVLQLNGRIEKEDGLFSMLEAEVNGILRLSKKV